VLLLVMSMLEWSLGLPTCLAGILVTVLVCLFGRQSPVRILGGIAWNELPLVAGLFILVEAINRNGAIGRLARTLAAAATDNVVVASAGAGTILAFACYLLNNLPAGLIASTVIAQGHPPGLMTDSLLIGVDIGPNLSVTGSLATILWLGVLRREGQDVGFWRFLKIGAATMPPALLAALAVRLLLG
jgi:arsenical pump membrane protein